MLCKCFKFIIKFIAYGIVGISVLGMFAFGFSLGIMLLRNAIMGIIG